MDFPEYPWVKGDPEVIHLAEKRAFLRSSVEQAGRKRIR
jgi:hypothetical protein